MWFEVVMRRYKDPKYYSVLKNTTLYYYYKVLFYTTKYYSVLQNTIIVLLRTTKYYSILPSFTRYYKAHMKRPIQCAEQQESFSNFTKYCACHEK